MKVFLRLGAAFGLAAFILVALSSQQAPSGQNQLGLAGAVVSQTKVADLTDANEKLLVGNSKVPVVIDFYATWCGPCKLLAPNIDALARLYKGKIKVVRCDIDRNPNLVAKYGPISAVPTVVILMPNGKWTPHVGYRSLTQLQNLVDAALKP